MELERRGCVVQPRPRANWKREESVDEAKPFKIPKREVWEAFKRVKANQGAAGVDEQSIAEFEADLRNNLYKLWNRLSSGSYFPPPVLRVEIPKADGGIRPLGIPTVADRVAQEVARRYLEPILEPVFHTDSYGYRPGKSATDAVGKARERCWRYDWVLDLDIKGFFDSIDWELMLKAVRCHTNCPWVLLYIERWLKAPVQMEDGSVVPRTAGTPQGGVISPLLANLFLHYAFDMWMAREFPHIPFERYADDAICHCRSAEEARALWSALGDRLAACKLVLHPVKTKVVYCKDLKSPSFYSRCQAENPHILRVLAIGDEFRERIGFCGTHEKFGKCLAQRFCNDELRWRNAGTYGSQPGSERVPNELGSNDGEILEESLGDDAGLDEGMISAHFAFDTGAVVGRFAM